MTKCVQHILQARRCEVCEKDSPVLGKSKAPLFYSVLVRCRMSIILIAALATQVVTKCLHIWKIRTDFKETGERVRGGQRDGGMGIGLEGFTRLEGAWTKQEGW